MTRNFTPRWTLNDIFTGGSGSSSFHHFLNELSGNIGAFENRFLSPFKPLEAASQWQNLSERICQAASFVACLQAQDVYDEKANSLEGEIAAIQAAFANVSNKFDRQLMGIGDEEFSEMLQKPAFKEIAFPLSERRMRAKEKLGLKEESLINDLSIDGYHGWSQLYGNIIGHVKIPYEKKGEKEFLSWGQAYTRLGSPQREERKAIFENSNHVWKEHEQVFAAILNHLSGFRLKSYEHHGWHFLKESLDHNRMQMPTLEAMWSAIQKSKPLFTDYLKHKAKLLGLKRLSWYDLEAPLLFKLKEAPSAISYDEAAHFIIKQFSSFSPEMGNFAKIAFEKQWIEAENRGGKRPGGFCTDVPLNKESRIFMTFTGTQECVFTLAHELGHAFHNHVIFNLPEMARHFPINLAETASTFAEMIVSEEAMKLEKNQERRIKLLDGKLQRSVIFFFNIHARFLFETRFHEKRKQGMLTPEQICSLMVESQKEAYCDALQEYHPFFWASKSHFNSTGIGTPFYNFPYTFGYLFSLAIYLKARKMRDFEGRYIALLADTGRMTVEDLAKKHFGEDLTSEQFWLQPIEFLKENVKEFLACSI